MRSPKSKHQGRYQWSEIQSFARELAKFHRVQENDLETDLETDHKQRVQEDIFHSRISREKSIRGQRSVHTHRRSEEQILPHSTSSVSIDLESFKAAWSRGKALTRDHNSPHQEELSRVERRQVECRDLEDGLSREAENIKAEDDLHAQRGRETLEQAVVENNEAQTKPNPWEQLRDHFLMVRELRLSKEASQGREIEKPLNNSDKRF